MSLSLEQREQAAIKELEAIQAEKDRLAGLTAEQRLAEQLHNQLCHRAHEDMCGWYYEKDWSGWTHARYLTAAQSMLAITDEGRVLAVLQAARGL